MIYRNLMDLKCNFNHLEDCHAYQRHFYPHHYFIVTYDPGYC